MVAGALSDAATYAAIVAFTVAVPGPDFAVVVRNAIAHGRRAGIATAGGVATGTVGQTSAAAAGLAVLLATSARAFTITKIIGAAYLCYLGIRAIRSALFRRSGKKAPADSASRTAHTGSCYRQGLFTNLLNPKVTLVYVSLMPQFIGRHSGAWWPAILISISVTLNIVWYSTLSLLMTRLNRMLRRPRFAQALDGTTGILFCGLGIWLSLQSRGLG